MSGAINAYFVKTKYSGDNSLSYRLVESNPNTGLIELFQEKNLETFVAKFVEYAKNPARTQYNFRFHLSPDFPEWNIFQEGKHILEFYQLSEEEISYLKRNLEEKITGKVKKRHNPEITPEDIAKEAQNA